ncbi:DUF1552 domain-containing protein [Agaribacterium haliotis]|uniref:DUF1552 domain-containing protein n=1 Tax=Agaribacterium haliotis TaxID=2013869 RepID=UPI00130420B1|nr:DUF1552 domain-containing protein [Agaribacterium haliotis]
MKRMSRRRLLGTSGLALGLPWLEYFAPTLAHANTGPGFTADGMPQRLFVVFNGLGSMRKAWLDASDQNRAPGSYNLEQIGFGDILKPLESKKRLMTVIKGATTASRDNTHESAEVAILTGQPYVGPGTNENRQQNVQSVDGISLDRHIANTIGAQTAFRTINTTVQGNDTYKAISHKGNFQPDFPIRNPYQAFDTYLGGNAGNDIQQLMAQRRIEVLDQTYERYQLLKGKVGAADQQRLDQHLNSLAELIDGMKKLHNGSDMAGACAAPGLLQRHELLPERGADARHFTDGIYANFRNNTTTTSRAVIRTHMDIALQSLQCGLSRVSVFDSGHFHGHGSQSHNAPENLYTYDLLNKNNRSANENNVVAIVNSGVRTAENLNYLVDRLSSISEGNGTMMDNSLILWIYSHADGNSHGRDDSTQVLIGNAGGKFDMGRYIKLNTADKIYHTELLTSIANCYGLQDQSFGDSKWAGRGRFAELGVRI